MGTYSAETLQIDEKWKDIIHEEVRLVGFLFRNTVRCLTQSNTPDFFLSICCPARESKG